MLSVRTFIVFLLVLCVGVVRVRKCPRLERCGFESVDGFRGVRLYFPASLALVFFRCSAFLSVLV